METIRIKSIYRKAWWIDNEQYYYYSGVIEECSGTGLSRNVAFTMDTITGKHVILKDIEFPLVFELLDEKVSILELDEGDEYEVLVHHSGAKKHGELVFGLIKAQL